MGKLLVQLHEELVDSLRTGYVKYWKGRWFNVKMAEKEDRSSFYAKVGKHQPWIFSSLFPFFLFASSRWQEGISIPVRASMMMGTDKHVLDNVLIWKDFFNGM